MPTSGSSRSTWRAACVGSPPTPPPGWRARNRRRTELGARAQEVPRAQEVLRLDVADLHRPHRRAVVRRKGGASDEIAWQTAPHGCWPATSLDGPATRCSALT